MDETPETVRHPLGDTGEPQGSQRNAKPVLAPGFSGVSQSRAGLDIHHEFVIYCFN